MKCKEIKIIKICKAELFFPPLPYRTPHNPSDLFCGPLQGPDPYVGNQLNEQPKSVLQTITATCFVSLKDIFKFCLYCSFNTQVKPARPVRRHQQH